MSVFGRIGFGGGISRLGLSTSLSSTADETTLSTVGGTEESMSLSTLAWVSMIEGLKGWSSSTDSSFRFWPFWRVGLIAAGLFFSK